MAASSSSSSARPRPISGSVGSRIRLVLGKSGSDWLLLVNEDDGNRQWQTSNWSTATPSSIRNEVVKQIQNCENKGRYVRDIGVGPTGDWFITGIKWDGTGKHSLWGECSKLADSSIDEWSKESSRLQVSLGSDKNGAKCHVLLQGRNGYWASGNLDDSLGKRLARMLKRNKAVEFVRLFGNGAYFISDDEGTEWKGMGTHCAAELEKDVKVEELAVAKDGSWVIIRPDHFECTTGVDKTLENHLKRFYREQLQRKTQRSREIREYNERIARVAREAVERAERERVRREEAERAERERVAREAREAEERQRVLEHVVLSDRDKSYEALLEDRILDEINDIKEQESRLQNRKRSIQLSIDQMPPNRRARLKQGLTQTANGSRADANNAECIVCHDRDAVRAVIPCGHHCLCDECAGTLVSGNPEVRLCPLCRGDMQSTLKIFAAK